MLDKLTVNNFKSHANTEIELKNLTLLVGTNSGGKSSIIQSLLLISHNITNPKASALNGHLVSIGNFSEARNLITNAKKFTLTAIKGQEILSLDFYSNDDNLENASVNVEIDSEELRKILKYSNNTLHYLSAHRIGGQDLYRRNFDGYDVFGLNGEYAIDYLQHHKTDPLDKELIKSDLSETLEYQVNYWINYIFGHSISTSSLFGTDTIKADYILKNDKRIRPKNMGSGVSYVISIIILCLASNKDDIIIIENPEIHLHPKAQSYLTDFFIMIANSGRQLIIETHSDHIFNGVRVSVYSKEIQINSVSINFFTLDSETDLSNHTKVELNERGRILNHTNFLFDQFENDINSLIGF